MIEETCASTCGPTVTRSTIRADVGVAIVPQFPDTLQKQILNPRAFPCTPFNTGTSATASTVVPSQINVECHRLAKARVTQDFLRHFQTFPWPACSPNLSSVEHVWDQLKRQIPSCHSVHDLELAVQDLWAHLPQDNIRCLINSMPDRVAVCIAAGGGSTRY
ncbi:transposable element Tcb2 transposase [Trichonephila clavipes]|nr:transposable element Tcb2 transposase [Trichonephila clavipes]